MSTSVGTIKEILEFGIRCDMSNLTVSGCMMQGGRRRMMVSAMGHAGPEQHRAVSSNEQTERELIIPIQ